GGGAGGGGVGPVGRPLARAGHRHGRPAEDGASEQCRERRPAGLPAGRFVLDGRARLSGHWRTIGVGARKVNKNRYLAVVPDALPRTVGVGSCPRRPDASVCDKDRVLGWARRTGARQGSKPKTRIGGGQRMAETLEQFHARSINDREGFWAEQARLIDWHKPFDQVLDYSRPPFARWFVGGMTNLCHNAVDRHLATLGDRPGLIYVSTETDEERTYTFSELHREVMRMAAIMRAHGVGKGDRVLVYMPMIPEAVFAILACARIGAIHSVVFGGFASNSLAARIDDATPKMIVSADAGSRAGKVIEYKPLVERALAMCAHRPEKVLMVDRVLAPFERVPGRDLDYAAERAAHLDDIVPVTWLESNEVSYTLYTSGTTGKPKGVQRDVGGYAVALAASMAHVFGGKPGETYFATSDIGWVV